MHGGSGLLLVRVWMEDAGGMRARITQSTDVTGTEESVTMANSVEGVTAAVTAWLHAFLELQNDRSR